MLVVLLLKLAFFIIVKKKLRLSQQNKINAIDRLIDWPEFYVPNSVAMLLRKRKRNWHN
jgi:hypothetical protein